MAGGGRGAAAALLLCALLAAACGPEDTAPSSAEEPSSTPSEKPTTGGGGGGSGGRTQVPVADPDHAVERPGPLKDRLYRPDMLIFDQEPLSDEMVDQIRDLPQVAAA